MTEPIGKQFIAATCMDQLEQSPQNRGLPQPPLELPPPAGADLIPLPRPETLEIPTVDLRTAVERRVSLRKYSEERLSLAELAYLLWMTQGVKRVSTRPATLRTVPSAGARHAFETYLLINRVDGLTPGVYRYIALEHALVLLDDTPHLNETIAKACLDQIQVRDSAVTFIWVAVVERMTWRYVQRGYRYLFLDAGHVCQNLYLAAEAIGSGVCAIAAYDDALLNQALKVDGETMFAVYAASLGKRLR